MNITPSMGLEPTISTLEGLRLIQLGHESFILYNNHALFLYGFIGIYQIIPIYQRHLFHFKLFITIFFRSFF